MNILSKFQLLNKANYLFKYFFRNSTKIKPVNAFNSKYKTSETFISDVFVINLDREEKRLVKIKNELQRVKISNNETLLDCFTRISAVNGKDLKFEYDKSLVTGQYPLSLQCFVDPDPQLLEILKQKNINISMTNEEIAVALSHISVWKKIVNQKLSYALILEDDVLFENKFSEYVNGAWNDLNKLNTTNSKFDVLYVSYKEVERAEYVKIVYASFIHDNYAALFIGRQVINTGKAS